MRVCWAGTFVPDFERNKRLREYLAASPVEVEIIREDLWPDDRIAAVSTRRLSIALRMLLVYPRLVARLLLASAPDLYLVSYPGWFDVPIVKLVALVKRRPLVFDVFISLYDTAVVDRGLVARGSLTARLALAFDRFSIRLSRRVIADCDAHARFLAELGRVPLSRFGVVFLGADETRFVPQDPKMIEPDLVVFYGTFVPLQGVEWIVRAAKLLEGSDLRFRLIGEGQTKQAAEKLATDLEITNLEFTGLMPQQSLVAEIGAAALVLGVFGTTPKANRVIPHKLFEAIACGRPVLTGATDAVVETFHASEVAVCDVGNDHSLAESITALLADGETLHDMGAEARRRFAEDFGVEAQGRRIAEELSRAM